MRPERLVRIALTCIRQTPELTQCNPASFVGALLVSAQMGLEPMAGRAYILPFWNSRANRKDAQFILGYRGISELFYRHAKAINFNWGIVHKNDEFEFEYGTNSKLRHRFGLGERGEVIGYYVIAELQGGAKPFLVMSKEDCLEHGKRHSKTYDIKTNQFNSRSPWFTDPDAMCLKTVLIQLSKVLPLSVELQQAIQADETSREYREGIDDALDIPAQNWQGEPHNPEKPLELKAETPQNGAVAGQEGNSSLAHQENALIRGSITDKQVNAIRELALKVYKDKAEVSLLNRVGGEYGVESIEGLSTENGADLIRKLSKEMADA
jgi:recombination protein RecT